jgi:hypothetical protein
MIKHLVLLKWKSGVSSKEIDRVTSGFQDLKDQIKGIASYSFGEDASIYRGNADYALIAEFLSEADLKAYVEHPKHQEFMREVTGPIMESFQSIQFIDRE